MTEYNGRRVFDLRTYAKRDGEMIPTRKGLMLRVEVFPEFLQAVHELEQALAECEHKAETRDDKA